MSFFSSKKEKKQIKSENSDWEDIVVVPQTLVSIQKIISNQERAYPNRLKTLQSLDTIIDNQRVILGYIDTMSKKMNDMEYRLSKQSLGIFSSYLKPSIFPYLDTDSHANSIRTENIIKRNSPKPNSQKN